MTEDKGPEPSFSRSSVAVRTERAYRLLLAGCALLTVVVTVGIVLTLVQNTAAFFLHVDPWSFLAGTQFAPFTAGTYGVLPLVSGTLVVTVGSAIIALPIGLAAGIYLSEYASPRTRAILKPALEVLAGVPTIVYGYFALVYITPAFQALPIFPFSAQVLAPTTVALGGTEHVIAYTFVVPPLRTFNALSASVVVGIMIIPMVSSISEDALSAVPDDLRDAAYGLGSTKFDVSTKVVVPAAVSGIISSYVLALSRAIGETMAVTVAAGMSPQMPYFPDVLRNFTDSVQTMTAAMVQIAGAESLGETHALDAMYAIGLTLFVMTFAFNVASEWVRQRFREVYE
ncbi:MAG: phosphate ABC transporter permease subunit PstC [Halobacteriaceae archaeon]